MNEERIAKVLGATLSTPNEADSNGEEANVVDGLFAIARAIEGLTVQLATQPPADGWSKNPVVLSDVPYPFDALEPDG